LGQLQIPSTFGRSFSNSATRIHRPELQCLYCPARFNSSYGAEEHTKSLHLRPFSWSCAALDTVEPAFDSSRTTKGATDICIYCGFEFANPADWNLRLDHILQEHEFGNCDQSSFFYAEDFRTHIKYSHAGTSGYWMNLLLEMCRQDGPPPPPPDPMLMADSSYYHGDRHADSKTHERYDHPLEEHTTYEDFSRGRAITNYDIVVVTCYQISSSGEVVIGR
jgi:hypothetical protein